MNIVRELHSALGEYSKYVAINQTGAIKHSFTKWQGYWFKDFEPLSTEEDKTKAPTSVDGPVLKATRHLVAFL